MGVSKGKQDAGSSRVRVRAEPASVLYMCHRRNFFFGHNTKTVCFNLACDAVNDQ